MGIENFQFQKLKVSIFTLKQLTWPDLTWLHCKTHSPTATFKECIHNEEDHMLRWAALIALILWSAGVSYALLFCCCYISPRQGQIQRGWGWTTQLPLSCGLMGYLTPEHFICTSTCSCLQTSQGGFHLKAHNRCDLSDLLPQSPTLTLMSSISAYIKTTDSHFLGPHLSLSHPAHAYPNVCHRGKTLCSCMWLHVESPPFCSVPVPSELLPHPSAIILCVVAAAL